MNHLKIAVWGLGNHAINKILPIFSEIKNLELLGVCSRNVEKVTKIAESYSCYGWNNPEDMLNNLELDIVYISTPIGLHYSMASQVLNAGKNVWCEKPLTCNYKNTKDLVALSNTNKKILTESFMHLYHPQFKRIKKFVDESKQINSIVCRFGIPELTSPGFRNDPELGGGALWDVGSYTISSLLGLFPEQQVKVIFAELVQKKSSQVDTSGRVLLRFSGGVTAYIEWAIGVAYKNEIDLWSSDGSMFVDKIFSKPKNYQSNFYLRDLNGNITIEKGDECEQFTEMFNDFILMFNDKKKVEKEKKAILRRAELLNNIVMFASTG